MLAFQSPAGTLNTRLPTECRGECRGHVPEAARALAPVRGLQVRRVQHARGAQLEAALRALEAAKMLHVAAVAHGGRVKRRLLQPAHDPAHDRPSTLEGRSQCGPRRVGHKLCQYPCNDELQGLLQVLADRSLQNPCNSCQVPARDTLCDFANSTLQTTAVKY